MGGVPLARQAGASALIAAKQVITAAWVDLGDAVDTRGAETLGVWIVLDIEGSNDVRIRALALHTAEDNEYLLPIRTVSSTDVKITPEYMEFANDVDQNMLLAVTLKNIVPMVQLQVMAGTLGSPAAEIDEADTTQGY